MPGSDPDLAGTDEGHLPPLILSHAPSAINHTTQYEINASMNYHPQTITRPSILEC